MKAAGKKATAQGLSIEERAAMKERVRELKAEKNKADWEAQCLGAIGKMQKPDRVIAERVHAIVKAAAPSLVPKTWYGMPAYASPDGKAVVYFRDAAKFKERYAMLGFNDSAKLDDGEMWPIAYALRSVGPAEEKKIAAFVKKAVR